MSGGCPPPPPIPPTHVGSILIKDIAKFIDGLGYGDFFETGYSDANSIFLNNLPPTPNNVISVYDTGGQGGQIGFPDYLRSVQVLVRNEQMMQAHLIIWGIFNALVAKYDNGYLEIDGRKMVVNAINPPISIGKDQNGLFEYSANFQIWTNSDN